MKLILKLTKRIGYTAALALLLASTAFSQAKPAAPTGVGMMDFERAVTRNDEGVKASNAFRAEGEKLRESLVKAQGKVTELQEKLTKLGPTAAESEKATLMREIDNEKKRYEVEQQAAQGAVDAKQDELFRPIVDRVRKVVEAYGKELNFAVVVDASEDLLYASDVVDITSEILRRVNADIVKNPSK